MSEQRPYPASDWLRGTGEMVWCPGCAFGFGAEHVTTGTGEYDCPNCGASSEGAAGRPAVPPADSEPVSAQRYELTALFGPCSFEEAEAFLEDVADAFGDRLGAAWMVAAARGVPPDKQAGT